MLAYVRLNSLLQKSTVLPCSNTSDCMVSQLNSAVGWTQPRVIEGVSVEVALWGSQLLTDEEFSPL